MGSGDTGEDVKRVVAVSGSAVAEQRRRALGNTATGTILMIDADLRVEATAGTSTNGGDGATALLGVSLAEVIDAPGESARIELAAREAIQGTDGELSLSTRDHGPTTVRFLPLRGGARGGAAVLVAISRERPVEAELDELRIRASDLETLARAAQALARSTQSEEVRGIVCEAASEVASSDLAVMLEPSQEAAELVVTASLGAELEGRSIPLDRHTLAAAAFRDGGHVYCGDLMRQGATAAWPLLQAGALAASWQSVRRELGVRGVIAVGWRRRTKPPERLEASLELLAGEAAVAIDRAAALERLTVLAKTDPLTDLSNRRAWQDELARGLARAGRVGERLSIGLIDLDELKAFNDRWGHPAGDRLLLTAAARWRRRLRLTDLIARIGGDEFAMTLPGCGVAEAADLGDQLREALPDGTSCSIGVAEWVPGESAESLMARTDRALYAAKDGGRDRTVALPAPDGTSA